jgi:hypothetical protein
MVQPPPTLLFRGKGNISQAERDAYPEGLVVLWQDKAWVDRPRAREWAERAWKQMVDADVAAGVADETDRYLLFQDNLDAQCPDRNPDYFNYLLDDLRTDSHMLPPGKTDQVHCRHPCRYSPRHRPPRLHPRQVQPVDRGMGRQIKIYMGEEEDKWLEDDGNLEKWEDNKLTASDRRILIATWFYCACMRAFTGLAKRKYFEHAGALMTADGSDDDKIKLEGVPKGENFTFMEEVMGCPPAPPHSPALACHPTSPALSHPPHPPASPAPPHRRPPRLRCRRTISTPISWSRSPKTLRQCARRTATTQTCSLMMRTTQMRMTRPLSHASRLPALHLQCHRRRRR